MWRVKVLKAVSGVNYSILLLFHIGKIILLRCEQDLGRSWVGTWYKAGSPDMSSMSLNSFQSLPKLKLQRTTENKSLLGSTTNFCSVLTTSTLENTRTINTDEDDTIRPFWLLLSVWLLQTSPVPPITVGLVYLHLARTRHTHRQCYGKRPDCSWTS